MSCLKQSTWQLFSERSVFHRHTWLSRVSNFIGIFIRLKKSFDCHIVVRYVYKTRSKCFADNMLLVIMMVSNHCIFHSRNVIFLIYFKMFELLVNVYVSTVLLSGRNFIQMFLSLLIARWLKKNRIVECRIQ